MNIKALFLSLVISSTSVLANDKVVVGYYVPWGKMVPSEVPYNKVTHINYGFGLMAKKFNLTDIGFDIYYDGPHLRNLTKLAKKNNVKILLSVGGWTGSQTFSKMVSKQEYRTKWIESAMKYLRKNTKTIDSEQTEWDLDGIDIDWEYPGRKGDLCNIVNKLDSKYYLELLKELRCAMDKEFPNNHKLITAAVRSEPFDGEDGKPMKDVSEFAKYFDFINLMAYDINSGNNITAANNPLYIKKGSEPYSFSQAIDSWNKAGFPKNKIVGGLAFYGRAQISKVDLTKTPNNFIQPAEKDIPQGDSNDTKEPSTLCPQPITPYSGYYQYKNLRKDILKKDPFTPCISSNYTRYFDKDTMTPWLFNKQTKKFISYEDPKSIQYKVKYAKDNNIRGVMFWDMTTDYNSELVDACQFIRN